VVRTCRYLPFKAKVGSILLYFSYSKAQFCYEEILSFNPQSPHINLRLAEIIYSQGTDNVESLYTARKYFSHALLLLDKPTPRALFGLLQVCKAIQLKMKKEDEKNVQLIATCKEQLKGLYGKEVEKMAAMQ